MVVISDKYFQLFRDLIYKESGINFYDSNRVVLEGRLRELLREYKIERYEDYYQLVIHDSSKLKLLLDSVTTNLTRFFRNAGHFESFKKYVVPKIVREKLGVGDLTFNFWSAGCSTGEECYSVAMVLDDLLPSTFKIRVVGSDLSLSCLLTANEGRYKKDKVKDIPLDFLNRYFIQDGDYYIVSEYLKKKVHFDYHNLKILPNLFENDVVFCRNVLIYFDEEAQKVVVNNLWNAMRGYSYLFIGHAESLFSMKTSFKFVKTPDTCFYKKDVRNISND